MKPVGYAAPTFMLLISGSFVEGLSSGDVDRKYSYTLLIPLPKTFLAEGSVTLGPSGRDSQDPVFLE